MQPRERVFAAIRHEEADRVPLNIWAYWNRVVDEATAKYGSMERFLDHLHVDMFTAFPAKGFMVAAEPVDSLDAALDMPTGDPDDPSVYHPVREAVRRHKEGAGRAVFCQTEGVFETACNCLGIQNAMVEFALNKERFATLLNRIARFSARFIENCLDLGVDVPHISDDWGQNGRLLISPRDWWQYIYPAEKIIVDAAKRRGAFVSLHSDGYIHDVLDGVVQMGIDVVHPLQESAGMDQRLVKRQFGGRLALYGGLDIRDSLPSSPEEELRSSIQAIMRDLKPGGGFIFCTSHTVQDDTPLERVEKAYAWAYESSFYGGHQPV